MVTGQQFKHEQKTDYKEAPLDLVAVVGKLRLCASCQSMFPTLPFMGPRTTFMLSK